MQYALIFYDLQLILARMVLKGLERRREAEAALYTMRWY